MERSESGENYFFVHGSESVRWTTFVELDGSSDVPGRSCQKSLNERIEQCFPSFSSVVNELKEREVERQLLLRDAPMRT